jgi:hypothetical protein
MIYFGMVKYFSFYNYSFNSWNVMLRSLGCNALLLGGHYAA